LEVKNYWNLEDLRGLSSQAASVPTSWNELLDKSRSRFTRLIIGGHCLSTLQGTPFSLALSRQILKILQILQDIMEQMDDFGALTPQGEELRRNYFVGERSIFSDESDTNKVNFQKQMTFPDPAESSRKMTCFWHGKINTPKFRIHFEWPVSRPQLGLRVAYIGPKISKK